MKYNTYSFHSALRILNTEPSIGASHLVSVHLAMQFQRRRFLEINQLETRIAYGGKHNYKAKKVIEMCSKQVL
jgi:hypothetical protein